MQITVLLESAKVAIHWDHILSPNHPTSGKETSDSWLGTAKRVAGQAIFVYSTALVGFKTSLFLFAFGGAYHFYKAYQKIQVSENDTTAVGDTHESENPEEVSQNNQLGIAAILKANEAGKKIGLLIGRDFNQPVPQEKGWLSVDGNIEGNPMKFDELASRIDLKMDFDNIETIQKLKGLFDKVVVDFSTLKFLSKTRDDFHTLLKQQPSSVLIVETECTVALNPSRLEKERSEDRRLFDEWKAKQTSAAIEDQKRVFSDQMDSTDKELNERDPTYCERAFKLHILNKHYPNRYRAAKEATCISQERARHLYKQHFNCVKLFHKTSFPTRKGMGRGEVGTFFELSNPVGESSKERKRKFESWRRFEIV
ncbi:hypothetical protein [Simkania negevensis]|uniref:Uncharacterized protein n=1 Tax=Simkania negevensis (strain ATCC VR-1471 / DSM 27360 / Z) TaxID=331113 RepID=F8L4G1_SIMNZ|nr:hypothetical protein [Simkania negevensis]CCB90212.1 unknown protein [Simkania negevensis Z]